MTVLQRSSSRRPWSGSPLMWRHLRQSWGPQARRGTPCLMDPGSQNIARLRQTGAARAPAGIPPPRCCRRCRRCSARSWRTGKSVSSHHLTIPSASSMWPARRQDAVRSRQANVHHHSSQRHSSAAAGGAGALKRGHLYLQGGCQVKPVTVNTFRVRATTGMPTTTWRPASAISARGSGDWTWRSPCHTRRARDSRRYVGAATSALIGQTRMTSEWRQLSV